jgi:hypothetical protein
MRAAWGTLKVPLPCTNQDTDSSIKLLGSTTLPLVTRSLPEGLPGIETMHRINKGRVRWLAKLQY